MMRRALLAAAAVLCASTAVCAQVRKVEDVVIYSDTCFHSAFPSVVKTRKGDFYLAFRRAPDRKVFGEPGTSHIDANSYYACTRSKDGKTWSAAEVFFAHPFGGIQDPCLLRLKDGTLLCEGYLWTHPRSNARMEEPLSVAEGAVFAGGFILRSKDNGKSWEGPFTPPSIPQEIRHSPFGGSMPVYNRGALLEASDGNIYWAVACTTQKTGGGTGVYLMVSHDKGMSWEYKSEIAADPVVTFNETSLYETPSGAIVAFLRTDRFDDQACIARSTDGGNTFTWESMGFQGHPCHALGLRDGRVLLTYGYRHSPFGVRARLLNPECTDYRSAEEIVLRDDANNGEVGYPWSVQIDRKHLLTVYYINTDSRQTRNIEGTILELVP